MIEIEYGNELWLSDADAANAEATRRACLLRDAENIEDRREIFFSDLRALTILPHELAEIDGLGRLIAGTAPKSGNYHIGSQRLSDVSVLSELNSLIEIDLGRTSVEGLPDLSEFANLQSLNLSNTRVSHLDAVRNLGFLQSLNLSGTKVSDLGPLSGLVSLESLHLSDTQVSDLGPLRGLVSLENLHLSDTQVSDLGPLSGLVSLQSLTFSSAKVSDLGALSGLVSLESLSLSSTLVSDLGPLGGLVSLHSLDLSFTPVSDITVLLRLPKFVAQNGEYLNIARTLLARQDRRWEMLAGLNPERQAKDIVLYLQGKHPDLRPPEEGIAHPTGPAAIQTRSPVKVVERDGVAELEDTQEDAAHPPMLRADASDQIRTVHTLAHGMVEGLELGANVPPLLLQRLKWYRDVSDPDARPVLNVLESVMVVLRGTIGDSYMRQQIDQGTCDGLDHLVKQHDEIGVPPAIEDPLPPVPNVPKDTAEQTGVIEQVAALQQVLAETRAEGLTGNTFIAAINSTVDVVNTANSPTIHMLSPEEEKERKGLWAWGLRMAAGMSQGLEAYGKIHGWSTTPMGAAILQKLADIVQKLLPYFS